MSDAGLILELKRNGEHLSEEELRTIGKKLESSEPALLDTFGVPAVWKAIPGVGLAMFEYWGEAADALIVTSDGKIAEAPFVTQLIDGEEVSMPEIPADNPPGDELLRRLMELDLNLASTWVAHQGSLLGSLETTVEIVDW